ncbi:MAG: lipopolysaccharide kinase InaA family protein, partial [Myxococcota bacterium]
MTGSLQWVSGSPAVQAAVDAWRSDESRGGVLRDNPRRRLVRIPGGQEGPLLVKHHRGAEHHPLREALKRWIGRSPAAREARYLQTLDSSGVPVPGLAGLARLPDGGSLLILRFLPGRAGVDGLPAGRAARSSALASLGAAVRALHQSGHIHGDLHGENVLFEGESAVLLDVQHVRRSRRAADRLRDLGELDYSLWGRASAADRLRLRRAALGGSPTRELLRAVGEAARDKAHQHGRSRTRRLLRPGRLAVALTTHDARGLRLREMPAEAVAEALRLHERALRVGGSAVLKVDGRSSLTRVEAGGRRLVVK